MNNIFKHNSINAIAFNLQAVYSLWKPQKSQEVANTHLAIGKGSQVTYHVVAMDKVAE